MTALSKHPKWRKLSSKDKGELKKFVRYFALLRKNGFYDSTSNSEAIKIKQQTYNEIYGD
jgi:hypothetical protein